MPTYQNVIVPFRGRISLWLGTLGFPLSGYMGCLASDQNFLQNGPGITSGTFENFQAVIASQTNPLKINVGGTTEFKISANKAVSIWGDLVCGEFLSDGVTDQFACYNMPPGSYGPQNYLSLASPFTLPPLPLVCDTPYSLNGTPVAVAVFDPDPANTGDAIVSDGSTLFVAQLAPEMDDAELGLSVYPPKTFPNEGDGYNYIMHSGDVSGVPTMVKVSANNPASATYYKWQLDVAAYQLGIMVPSVGIQQPLGIASISPRGFIVQIEERLEAILILPDLTGWYILDYVPSDAETSDILNFGLYNTSGSNRTLSMDRAGNAVVATSVFSSGSAKRLVTVPQPPRFSSYSFNTGCWPCTPVAQGTR